MLLKHELGFAPTMAVREVHFDIIRILFDNGASTEHGQLLHLAVKRNLPNSNEVFEYLLDKGASINCIMFENCTESYEQEWLSGLGTLLHSAVGTGRLDMAEMLLQKRVDPWIKSSMSRLAIEEAEYRGPNDVAARLRSAMSEWQFASSGEKLSKL